MRPASTWSRGRQSLRRRARQDIVEKLNASVVGALADPAVRKKFADQSYELPPRDQQTPEYLAKFQKAEIDKWWPIIKSSGIGAQAN